MSIPDPIVLLDARAKYVHPAFQMTRASTKTVFDSAGRLVTVPANAIGWDHDPATGQSRGYLAEPAATNLLLHSNDLSESYWVKYRASITPDAIIGPDGESMAKLVEDTQAGPHAVLRVIPVDDTSALTFSVVLKAAERHEVNIRITEEGAPPVLNCSFDLAGGAAGGVDAFGDATAFGSGIEDLGGGYYRCWLSGSLSGDAANVRFEARMLADGSGGYTGDGASGLYLGYMQAEVGAYPTSYIETGAATATRAGDALTLANLSTQPWWTAERGTLVVDIDDAAKLVANGVLLNFGIPSGLLAQNIAGSLRLGGTWLGTDIILIPSSSMSGRRRLAMAWDGSTLYGASNGAVRGSASLSGKFATTTPMPLGMGARINGTNAGNVSISRAVYYPARLSNADLQSLTAIQE